MKECPSALIDVATSMTITLVNEHLMGLQNPTLVRGGIQNSF